MKRFKRKKIVYVFIILTSCFFCIQLYRPEIPHQTVTGEIEAPSEVKAILKRACYDCHSNITDLRWFDQIAPAYWLVADHIKKGKEGLNFSEWNKLPHAVQNAKLWEAFNQIQQEAMPIKSYQLLHSEANITEKEKIVLKQYVNSLVPKLRLDTAKIVASTEPRKNLETSGSNATDLPVALNGIAYMPDYKNWQPISTTERFDNGTMRVIFGNDIAIKAIKEQKTNPWPDGTTFAKAAWEQLTDGNGNISTGSFRQIEYMIKDRKKFASTAGWGWARFLSSKLKPYGKTVLFTTECINCHRPMKGNDFVFTSPINQ